MQPRNSWVQGILYVASKAGGTTGTQCHHAQCMGQMNFLNNQVEVQAVGSSEFLGLTYVQLCACTLACMPAYLLWHWELNPEPCLHGHILLSLSYIPRLL